MKVKKQELFEILAGAWVMMLPELYFFGMRPSLLLLGIGAGLLYLVSAYKKSVLWYILVSIILLSSSLVVEQELFPRVAVVTGAVIGSVGFFAGRIKESPGLFAGISYWYLMIAVPGYAFAIYQKSEIYKGRACLYAAVLFLICLLEDNQKEIDKYVRENEKLHRFPKKRVLSQNRQGNILLSILVLGGMAVGYFFAPEVKLALKPIEVDLTPEVSTQEPVSMPNENILGMLGEYEEAPAWVKQLGEFIYETMWILIVISGIVLLILGVILLLRKYHNEFRMERHVEVNVEEDRIEQIIPRTKGIFRIFEKKTPSEQIRRSYKKWIKSILKIVPKTASPAELEKQARIEDEELHNLYEKARYAQIMCSAEESTHFQKKAKTYTKK